MVKKGNQGTSERKSERKINKHHWKASRKILVLSNSYASKDDNILRCCDSFRVEQFCKQITKIIINKIIIRNTTFRAIDSIKIMDPFVSELLILYQRLKPLQALLSSPDNFQNNDKIIFNH